MAQKKQLKEAASLVKGSRDNLLDKLSVRWKRNRQLEKELEQLKAKAASAAGNDLAGSAVDVKGTKVLAARLDWSGRQGAAGAGRPAEEQAGQRGRSCWAACRTSKVVLVAGVTQDLTAKLKAGDLMKQAAAAGGRQGRWSSGHGPRRWCRCRCAGRRVGPGRRVC